MDYKSTGVDIDSSNTLKTEIKDILTPSDPRVMNRVGDFASLYNFEDMDIKHPVIVTKTEEPGSKQLLAFEMDKPEYVCYDMINHLVNDCIMCGAKPLIVQDCIVCGALNNDVVKRMIDAMSTACKENECTLVGGETSVQPGVIPSGTYILSSSIVGVVERDEIINGGKIAEGDDVLALASSGPHTNGYTLIRALLDQHPELRNDRIFMEDIMRTHTSYYMMLREHFSKINGMAHITGGGIKENLNRILPPGLDASIDLSKIEIPEVFRKIKEVGDISDDEMIRTFNIGVGVTVVINPMYTPTFMDRLSQKVRVDKIGEIVPGNQAVKTFNTLRW
jgi:phosphoribosylformylglycinamidine cyclo-ligase